jgi:IS30 family transposase
MRGQSINHILANHKDEIGLSEKTIYNYIDSCAFHVRNIDLPKKVAYRQRRQKHVFTSMDYKYRNGRSYEDFKQYTAEHPDEEVVEMDTVKGARGSGKVLLTLIFRKSNFMLIFLMPDGTQESVLTVFDILYDKLGAKAFRSLFKVILTDNGVEFKNPLGIEYALNGCRRTRVFFCDPQASWQKPHVEKNHVFIRRILPKGTSFNNISAKDILLVCRHINSVPREIFGNKSPFDLFSGKQKEKLLDHLNLAPIPTDEVLLNPKLLKK